MAACPLLDDFGYLHPSINLNECLSILSTLDPENILQNYLKNLNLNNSRRNPSTTTVNEDKDKVIAKFDVKEFKPEEITVKLSNENVVIIEGKHEEKQDEHGYISRHFVRRYILPEGSDANQLKSKMSRDGILTITVPKVLGSKQGEFTEIPITRTEEATEENKETTEDNKEKV